MEVCRWVISSLLIGTKRESKNMWRMLFFWREPRRAALLQAWWTGVVGGVHLVREVERVLETGLSRAAGAALRLFQCRLGFFQEFHL